MRQMILRSDLPFKVKPIIDITDDLPRHPTLKWPQRKSTKRIIVHHTGVVNGTLRGHANYHVGKGRPGIGYSTVIVGDQAYQTNDWMARTIHAGNNNDDTISVSVEGNFTLRPLSDGERNVLHAVILTYMGLFNIPVSMVFGHGEVSPTACPGFDMNRVRTDLVSIIEQMQYQQSPTKAKEEVFATVARVNDLYAKYLNKEGSYSPGIQREAERKLLIVSSELKKQGFIK